MIIKDVLFKVWDFGKKVLCDWLPKNQAQWYKDNIKCLDKKNKVCF